MVQFVNLDSFGVICLVLEILAVEISAFSQIMGVNDDLLTLLSTAQQTAQNKVCGLF